MKTSLKTLLATLAVVSGLGLAACGQEKPMTATSTEPTTQVDPAGQAQPAQADANKTTPAADEAKPTPVPVKPEPKPATPTTPNPVVPTQPTDGHTAGATPEVSPELGDHMIPNPKPVEPKPEVK